MTENARNRVHELASEQTEFRREIGLFGAISIIGGIMIGSGIFYLGAYVLQRSGMSEGTSLLCWLIGGIVSLMGGLCYAELGATLPRAGGTALYLSTAYHPLLGFLAGFSDWLLSGPGTVAALAVALPTTLRGFWSIDDGTIRIIAVAVIIVLTYFNCLGIKNVSLLQNVFMVGKLVPIVIILLAALLFGKVTPDLGLQPLSGPVPITRFFGMVAFAVVATLWAYEGWANVNTVAEEIIEPHKNLPRALFLAIGGIMLLYVAFNYAIYRVLSIDQIQSLLAEKNLYLGTVAARTVLGHAGAVIVTIGMALSVFGSLNGCVIAQPRTYYAMAKEGHFFKAYARLSPKYRVPTVSIVIQGVLSVVMVMLRSLDQLTSLVVFSSMIYFMLGVFGVIVLRRRYPELERPFKVPGYPIVPFLSGLSFLALVVNTFLDDPTTAVIGTVVPLVGCVAFWLFDRRLKKGSAAA